jgi:hypothetical protein
MASGGGVHGDTLGCHYFPKGVAKESPMTRHLLPLAPLHAVWLPPLVDPIVLLVEFLVVPVCAYALPYNGQSILQCLTLPPSFGFHSGYFAEIASLKADALPSLFSLVDALPLLSLAPL